MVTPDLTIGPTAILSLNDRSAMVLFSADYALSDQTSVSFSAFVPVGREGTEFGGRETSASSGIFSGPAQTIALGITHFR